MRETNAILEEAYNTLRELGAASTHCQFSRDFLRKSSRYMSFLRANDHMREPSIEAVLATYITVDRYCDNLRKSGDLDGVKTVDALADRLWSVIHSTVMTAEIPMRSKRSGVSERE